MVAQATLGKQRRFLKYTAAESGGRIAILPTHATDAPICRLRAPPCSDTIYTIHYAMTKNNGLLNYNASNKYILIEFNRFGEGHFSSFER